MIVCIAEKPSVAKDIADILGARNRHEGYIEGNGYQVTWTFGHLCTLKEPHEYTPAWKSWSLGSLPMIPPRFGIKLIADTGIEKQFKVIQRLMQNADEIINCGDAGQEGELIQRECRTAFPNITIKKIPQMLLGRCEFAHDDYSLNIVELPTIEEEEYDEDFNDETIVPEADEPQQMELF